MGRNYHVYRYYVEGESEKKLLETLKKMNLIKAGRVEIFDIVQQSITNRKLMTISPKTIIVLVFDTDTDSTTILEKNMSILKKNKNRIKDIICIPQVSCLEDEIKKSCSLTNVKDLLGSKSNKDFKRDLIHCQALDQCLIKHNFKIELLWTSKSVGPFTPFINTACKIKILQKS